MVNRQLEIKAGAFYHDGAGQVRRVERVWRIEDRLRVRYRVMEYRLQPARADRDGETWAEFFSVWMSAGGKIEPDPLLDVVERELGDLDHIEVTHVEVPGEGRIPEKVVIDRCARGYRVEIHTPLCTKQTFVTKWGLIE